LHWAAYQNSLFFIKLGWRLDLDMLVKDNANLTPFHRASENNSMRVINFFNGHSKYPFRTNYFLKNKIETIEFNFFPKDMSSIF